MAGTAIPEMLEGGASGDDGENGSGMEEGDFEGEEECIAPEKISVSSSDAKSEGGESAAGRGRLFPRRTGSVRAPFSGSSTPSHRHTLSGRITKTQHQHQPQQRPSAPIPSSSSSSSSSPSAALSAPPAPVDASPPPPLLLNGNPSADPDRLAHAEAAVPVKTTAGLSPSTTSPSSLSSSITTTTTSSASDSSANSVPDPALVASSAAAATAAATAATTTAPAPAPAPAPASAALPPPLLEMDAPLPSFWGPEPVPLPSRFARIKRNLIRGHEAELEACWRRLIVALRAEVDHIEGLGAHLIPSIEFADIEDSAQTARFGHDLRRYGVGVIRKVVPRADADAIVHETIQYLDSKRHIRPFQRQDPTCFDYFWTPAQVRSRAHPKVLQAQRFMMSLWDTTPEDRLVTRLPITYVDRIRIHRADEQQRPHGIEMPPMNPQSADDWITALQSSAGIIAQVDNGSLERWEPDGYGQTGTYDHIFRGSWEEHDPWECASRVSATMDLYNGHGACTIFRMFQGVLALSTIEPGMIRLMPSPRLATAYYLLRPFFTHLAPPPESRCGPEWDAYLAPENWRLQRDPDTIIYGAVPGHAQRITEHWHPHLHLRVSMITLPTLQPGDYILWHPDLPYHISSNNPGLRTPNTNEDDTSMLVYLPAAPLTQTNALYLARQRKAFQRGHPGPDFDSTGRGTLVEDAETRPGEKEIAEVGGPAALQAMGLAPWEVAGTRAETPPPERFRSKDDPSEMDVDADAKSLLSSSSASHAEAEVVRLANIILFPEQSMLGY